ncbi:o-succinylbenzoate synthase [Euhalothece natronophila Z-M001]|uniref:o-succinylbenzoate synthase n=1 Tax=Euhalothece natronophila Z-M001 TaxID=522448 RepID=A0A5B8NL19_9CHRO|nr:o-succinylbenzoate synthase [Euhalothece natronophila]QDZ38819.1 o-succinylbenzoate synthase [Euhalothece natronophila Z-M001]
MYQLSVTPYNRPFRQPLQTSQGEWKTRKGIIIALEDSQGRVSYGEIAPLPSFGSETYEEALKFCSQFSQGISLAAIYQIPEQFPACQFAFESALKGLTATQIEEDGFALSYLLPAGKKALEKCHYAKEQGQKTCKWKIGVFSLQEELAWFQQLINILPEEMTLRLDANGGLTVSEAEQWLKVADASGRVEFIEQPLPPSQFQEMQELAKGFQTVLALDESVGTLSQLETCYLQGWRGVFVVKCAIAGYPHYLRQLCQTYPLDLVLSSVMETSVARQAVFRLATTLSPHRALGFGVNHWFSEKSS